MQPKIVHLILAGLSAVSVSAAPVSAGCQAMSNACRVYIKSPMCSDTWKQEVQSCLPSSCTDTVSNILSQCTTTTAQPIATATTEPKVISPGCAAMANGCRVKIISPMCTEEWKQEVKSCMPAGCLNDTDVFEQCTASSITPRQNTDGPFFCNSMELTCRFQIKETLCTDAWKAKVESCMPAVCLAQSDAMKNCAASSTVATATATPSLVPRNNEDSESADLSVGCIAMANSCKFKINETQCTDAWTQQVNACIPAACNTQLKEAFSNCPATSTTSPIVPGLSVGCMAMANACKVEISEQPCTPAWTQRVQSCIPAACTNQLKEAFSVCPTPAPTITARKVDLSVGCMAMANACKVEISEQPCSPAWTEKVQSCIPSSCDSQLKEALAQCPVPTASASSTPVPSAPTVGCKLMANACRFKITAAPCTDEWKSQVSGCIPSGCTTELTSAMSVCSA